MKTIRALAAGLVLVTGAFAQDREFLAEAFSDESLIRSGDVVRSNDVIHSAPAALLLDPALRAELLKHWRGATPESAVAIRMKGLLLEDAGDPQAGEFLKDFPGDRVRLLWRAGKPAEARALWQEAKADRLRQAAAAMLPVVARGDVAERERFRDFLLEGLSPREVVNLCQASGLPAAQRAKPEVMLEWAKEYPAAAGAADEVPDSFRLAALLRSRSFTREQFEEIRRFLKDPAKPMVDTAPVIDVLVGNESLSEPLKDLLLCDWIEARPGGAADEILRRCTSSGYGFAEDCGLAGMLALEAFLKTEPGNRPARLAVAVFMRHRGASREEVVAQWRQAAPATLSLPAELPPAVSAQDPFKGLSTEGAALEFGSRLSRHDREAWFAEWRQAAPHSASERLRMGAWLKLEAPFWEAWPEVAADPAMTATLLEYVARDRVPSGSYRYRTAVLALYASLDQPPGELRHRLRLPNDGAARPAPVAPAAGRPDARTASRIKSLNSLRFLLVNALAVDSPFRSTEASPEDPGTFRRVYGYRVRRWSRGEDINPEQAAAVQRWLACTDKDRLSARAQRAIEVNRVVTHHSADKDLAIQFSKQLQTWWETAQDPDAGKMLLDDLTRQRRPAEEVTALAKLLEPHFSATERSHLLMRGSDLARPKHPIERAGNREDTQWIQSFPWAEGEDDKFAALRTEAARAQVILGRDDNPLLWGMQGESGPRKDVAEGAAYGMAALESMGAREADLALCAYRLTLYPEERAKAGERLRASGRMTWLYAMTYFPYFRMQKDKAAMKQCLDTMEDAGTIDGRQFLDDPSLLVDFGPARVEEWLDPVLERTSVSEPQKEGRNWGAELVSNFARTGDGEATLRIAARVLGTNGTSLEDVLRSLPMGKERTALIAASLSGKLAEFHPSFRPWGARESFENLPHLEQAEWQEVLALLTAEERWEVRKPAQFKTLLLAFLAAGSSDPAELARLAGLDDKQLADLLKPPGLKVKDPVLQRQLSALVAGFVKSIPAGPRSQEMLELLAEYVAEDAEIAAALRQHLAALDAAPSDKVVRLALLCTDTATALALAQRMPERGDPTSMLVIRATSIFAETGYMKEGWNLLELHWPKLKDSTLKSRGRSALFLPLAQAAGKEEIVRLLLDAAGPNYPGTNGAREWLENRHRDKVEASGLSARWSRAAGGRGRLEWSLIGKRVGAGEETGGDELEIVAILAGGERKSLWRGPANGTTGVAAFEEVGNCESLSGRYRSRGGAILEWHSSGAPLENSLPLEWSTRGTPSDGPLPDLTGRAFVFPGVVAETAVPEPGMPLASAWIRGTAPAASGGTVECVLTWLDDAGRELGSAKNSVSVREDDWSLLELRGQPQGPLAAIKRVRVTLERPPGKPLAIAGLTIGTVPDERGAGESPRDQAKADASSTIGHLPVRISWLDATRTPWLVGGEDGDGPLWFTWDPATKTSGPRVPLRSAPQWMARLGEDVAALDGDGDLWRFRPGVALPDLLLALPGKPMDLALSPDARWLATANPEGAITVWDLTAPGGPRGTGPRPFHFRWQAFQGTGDDALLAIGENSNPQRPPAWYRATDFTLVAGKSDFPPLPVAGSNRHAYGAGGISAYNSHGTLQIGSPGTDPWELADKVSCFAWTPEGKLAYIDSLGGVHLAEPAMRK